jgi:uncharacterized RDD family membrane protein YckC
MKRIYAWLIDFVIVCIIQSFLVGFFLFKPLIENRGSVDIINFMAKQMTLTYCSMVFMLVRDNLGKKSIGKRIIKLKIVEKETGIEAGFMKRFVRNITWFLGPIEIIVFLVTKERLGDKIAKTNIVEL